MATEAPRADAAPADPKTAELKAIQEDLSALHRTRLRYRSRLGRFQRTHRIVAKHLPEHAKQDSDKDKQAAVKQTYQLLRSFCFAYNWVTGDKDSEKFAIPADFEDELKEVLTDQYYSSFGNAIKASKEEYQTHLPAHLTSEVCDRLLKFVANKEKDQIVSKYEGQLTDLTDKINSKTKERDAIRPPAPKKDPKPKKESKDAKKTDAKKDRKRRNSGSSDSDTPLEDRLHRLLKEVGKRTNSVRFSKDDFASLSEAQSQLDALLRETVTEIMEMKQSLRSKFARAQDSGRVRTTRRNRSKPAAAAKKD